MSTTILKRLTLFWAEMRRRKVIRAIIVYWLVARAAIEIVSVLEPAMQHPDWLDRMVIILAMVAFPVVVVMAWAYDLSPDTEHGATDRTATTGDISGQAPEHSIAVLPFENLSEDSENLYFGDGIATEILDLLYKLPKLQVSSRTSSFSFRGRSVNVRQIAEELGVSTILEGSVRRAADRVRISVQLIDAYSDSNLWSEKFDRQLQDIFEVQDEIANKIAQALQLQLTRSNAGGTPDNPATNNMLAYDFYLRGTFQFERGNMRAAIEYFLRATQLDPGFAKAWAGLANSYSWICMWEEKTPENIQRGNDASKKAIELAPMSADAHASRAFALIFQKKYEEAMERIQQAIELDPRSYEAYYFGGRLLMPQGRYAEAAEFFGKASEIRPDDVAAPSLQSNAYAGAGDSEAAERATRKAIEAAERQTRLSPDDSRAWSLGAICFATLGEPDESVRWAERALASDPEMSSPSTTYNIACSFAQCGAHERALDVLEKLSASAALYRDWIERDSDFDSLRENPRFTALIGKLET